MLDTVNECVDSRVGAADTIQWIAVDTLADHPQNPRVIMREDVIAAISAGLTATGRFDPAHALLVRPKGDDTYEVISGHHRKRGAIAAGLRDVPCWVREMSDEKAFMELVNANNQGELDILEIGLHADEATEKGKWGKSVKAYAEETGRKQQTVSDAVLAARVAREVTGQSVTLKMLDLFGKTTHLVAIHAGPRSLWSTLVSFMLNKGWSVADTKHYVAKVAEYDIPSEHADWLPVRVRTHNQ